MKAWAQSDAGDFPDKNQMKREVIAELETLCRGLDGWGAVDPNDVMEPEWNPEFGECFD